MVSRFLIVCLLLLPVAAFAGVSPPLPKPSGAITLSTATGWSLFRRPWISSPSSLAAGGGVGPLYNARACDSCHVGGGPGRVAEDAIDAGMTVRVGHADAKPDPVYGAQIQTHALPGFDPEANVAFRWEERTGPRVAAITSSELHYGALAPDSHVALRRAPSLLGIGLLAAIPDSEILKHARTGRPAWIADAGGRRKLGRFGWKASEADLTAQISLVFQRDFGIGTSDFPGPAGECTQTESKCRSITGPDIELPDELRDLIADYLRSLYSPDPLNEKTPGFVLFKRIGCAGCHATLKDGGGRPVRAYTDLLLHDLGSGLDDGIADGAARSSEWRTAPLWDVKDSLSQGGLLHDGRARSIDEAVAWHGGEASQARAAFNALSSKDRRMVADFLLGH